MKNNSWLTFALAALAAALIWALSPVLTHRVEPWDAGGLYYHGGLVLAGFGASLIRATPLWAHYTGAITGQIAYELIFLRIGSLVILGALLLFYYCLYFLAGAWLGGYLRRKWLT